MMGGSVSQKVGLTWPSPVIRTPHPNPPPQGWRASESCPWPRDCRGLLATRTETSAPTREQLRVERGHPSHREEQGHRGQEEPGTTEAPDDGWLRFPSPGESRSLRSRKSRM